MFISHPEAASLSADSESFLLGSVQKAMPLLTEEMAVLFPDFLFGFVASILPVKTCVLEIFILLFHRGVTLNHRRPVDSD